jgi:leader peptidase (prepilin peptidase)/N-methyltransferase
VTDLPSPFIAAAAFILGLAFGSFLNVLIYRLPRGLSIVPASKCPNCNKPVKPWFNVPVLGWLMLRGRCSECKHPFSVRYALIELSVGALFAGSALSFGVSPPAAKYMVFGFLVIGLVFTDADLHLLPDALTLPGFWLGLLFSLFIPVGGAGFLERHGADSLVSFLPYDLRPALISLFAALLGAAVGALFIWGVGEAYKRVRGVEGMGFGDVKLMAMVGVFLGVKLTVLTLVLGSVVGSIAGLSAMLTVLFKRMKRYSGSKDSNARSWASAQLLLRHYEMPFGVFLGSMALVSQWFGDRMMAWYLSFYQ